MSDPFLSSEEYEERAHALHFEEQFDEALELLREGLTLYPTAVELHVGVGYARLAREEYAWARRSFEEALLLDPEHENALAGLGDVLLRFGQVDAALRAFDRILLLGYDDDEDLMLQIGRALCREGQMDESLAYFQRAIEHSEDCSEAMACIGYAQHRLGMDVEAMATLRHALAIFPGFAEARVYLANMLYDAGDIDAALHEFEQTSPEDHWDELGIIRMIELRKLVHHLDDNDSTLEPWKIRLRRLAVEPDSIDELLAGIELEEDDTMAAAVETPVSGQLQALGTLLSGLASQQTSAGPVETAIRGKETHRVIMRDGSVFEGTWDAIVRALRDARDAGCPIEEYMRMEARRFYGATGRQIESHAAEAFIRGSADAGMLRIVR